MSSVLKNAVLIGIGLFAGIVTAGLTISSNWVQAAAGDKYKVVIVSQDDPLEAILNSNAKQGCTLVETSGRGVYARIYVIFACR